MENEPVIKKEGGNCKVEGADLWTFLERVRAEDASRKAAAAELQRIHENNPVEDREGSEQCATDFLQIKMESEDKEDITEWVLRAASGKTIPQVRLTNAQRLEVCKQKVENPRMSQSALARWAAEKFGVIVTQSGISGILKKRLKLEAMSDKDLSAKRPRKAQHPQLDEALATWVRQCQTKDVTITGELIKNKAKIFATRLGLSEDAGKFSNGWLQRFQERNKLRSVRVRVSSQESIDAVLPELRAIIARYKLNDVFNMDETGLFYCMVPEKTVEQQEPEGPKKEKNRVTIAFTTNADGSEKFEPFFIGKAMRPHCFNHKTGEQLGFYYRSNKNACMTRALFQEWFKKLNADMKIKDRRILLLLDNTTRHVIEDPEMENVRVAVLPPHRESKKAQGVDVGVIAAFKRRYRRFHLQNALDRVERGETDIYTVDQLTAMKWSKAAWEEISSATLSKCFRRTGLLEALLQDAVLDQEERAIEQELQDAIRRLPLRNPVTIEHLLNSVVEEDAAHVVMNDEEIIAMVRDPEEEEEQVQIVEISIKEKLKSLAVTASLLDVSIPADRALHRRIREIQRSLRTPATQ